MKLPPPLLDDCCAPVSWPGGGLDLNADLCGSAFAVTAGPRLSVTCGDTAPARQPWFVIVGAPFDAMACEHATLPPALGGAPVNAPPRTPRPW